MNHHSSETGSDAQTRRAPRTALCLLSALAMATALTAGACSDKGGETDGGAGSDNGGIDNDALGGDGDGDGAFGGGKDEDGNCIGLEVNQGCAGQVYEGEAVPLDLYIMFDQSGSMAIEVNESTGETRMDVVTAAVDSFLNDEESVGMGIGIGYFGHHPIPETSCDGASYADADVEIAALPGNIDPMLASIAAREPIGETPTGAAIRGACDYVTAHKSANPGRSPAVLLVTDGEPKAPATPDCNPTLSDAGQAAKTCYEDAGIPVYVLGVGPSLDNLDLIAESGGTESAYLADLDNTDQVLGALRAVRIAAQIPCELEIVESESDVDYNASTVAYQNSECDYIAIERVESIEGCSGDGGWYFDDPAAPTNITLCETTCGNVKSTGRQLFYSIGCELDVIR